MPKKTENRGTREMKKTNICFYLLLSGVVALLLGELNKPTYVVSHSYTQLQVLFIAIGVAVTILLILYVIASVWARWINKAKL